MKYVSNAKMNTSVESGTIFEGKCGLVDITIHLYRKNKFSGRGDTFYLSSNCVGISNMKLESKTERTKKMFWKSEFEKVKKDGYYMS